MIFSALSGKNKTTWLAIPLPKKLAACNKRFGTPHWILLVFYLVGLVPILVGLDLSTVANSTVILTTCIRGVIAYSAIQLPKKLPELWQKSHFYVSDTKLRVISVFTIVFAVISVVLLIVTTSPAQIVGNVDPGGVHGHCAGAQQAGAPGAQLHRKVKPGDGAGLMPGG